MFYTDQIKDEGTQYQITTEINSKVLVCHFLALEAGWCNGVDLNDPQTIATKLCLIHSEVTVV